MCVCVVCVVCVCVCMCVCVCVLTAYMHRVENKGVIREFENIAKVV